MHRFLPALVAGALAAVSVLTAAPIARACGLTPPIGPNGLPTICHGDADGLRLHAGLSVGGTSTSLDFGADRASLRQAAAVASLDVQPIEALTLSVALGASLGGVVDFRGTRFDLAPGAIGGVAVAYRFLGRGALPFVQPSFGYSLSLARAVAPDGAAASFTAKDWRAGVVVGKAFGPVAPFLLARTFGGGTEWSAGGGHGADHFRYQLGTGSAFALTDRLDAIAELAFLGERRATLGVGLTF